MNHEYQELNYRNNNALGVFVGLLAGGLAGALTMLLLAPQSGEKTRKQIEEKGIELRDRTTGMIEDTMSQVRSKTNQIMVSGRKNIDKNFKELKQQGQELAIEQLGHVSDAANAGKKAIQNS